LLVNGVIGETHKVSLVLFQLEVLPEQVLNLGLVDHPARNHLLFLFFLDDNIGGVDLFFVQFAALLFFNSFDCGFFLVAEL
jgi:hypothetical protein